jgi:hypothetical protein
MTLITIDDSVDNNTFDAEVGEKVREWIYQAQLEQFPEDATDAEMVIQAQSFCQHLTPRLNFKDSWDPSKHQSAFRSLYTTARAHIRERIKFQRRNEFLVNWERYIRPALLYDYMLLNNVNRTIVALPSPNYNKEFHTLC